MLELYGIVCRQSDRSMPRIRTPSAIADRLTAGAACGEITYIPSVAYEASVSLGPAAAPGADMSLRIRTGGSPGGPFWSVFRTASTTDRRGRCLGKVTLVEMSSGCVKGGLWISFRKRTQNHFRHPESRRLEYWRSAGINTWSTPVHCHYQTGPWFCKCQYDTDNKFIYKSLLVLTVAIIVISPTQHFLMFVTNNTQVLRVHCIVEIY